MDYFQTCSCTAFLGKPWLLGYLLESPRVKVPGSTPSAPNPEHFGTTTSQQKKKKKKPGREKIHLDAVPDWIYPEFQKWGNFFGLGIRGLSTKAARKNVDRGLSSQVIPQNYNRQLLSTTPTGIFLSNQVFLEKNWELLTTAPLDIPKLGKIPQNFNIIRI